MQVFRLCKTRWAATAFSGEGALRYAGRWHFAGTPIVYTGSSRALTALEVLVHLELHQAPPGFVLIPAEIPEPLITTLEELPAAWDALPPGEATQKLGSTWIRSLKSAGLRVPSVIVPGDFNVLLNPLHPEFIQVKLGEPEPFVFDPRLRPSTQEGRPAAPR